MDTAADAWARLAASYASRSKAKIWTLRSQFFSLNRGNDSIAMYVQRAKSIGDQLAILRSPIIEDDLITCITDGLGLAYLPSIRALEARLASISFDNLYGLLLSEEIQLARDDSVHDSLNASANFNQCSGCGRGSRG